MPVDTVKRSDDPFAGKSNIYVAMHTWCYWSVYAATQQAMRPLIFEPPFATTGASLEQIQREYGGFLMAAHLVMLRAVFSGTPIEQDDLDARVHFVLQWVHEFTHSFGPDRDLDLTDRQALDTAERRFMAPVFKYLPALARSEPEAIALLWRELRQHRIAPMQERFARFVSSMCDGVRGGILEIQASVGFDFQWDYDVLRSIAALTPSAGMFPPLEVPITGAGQARGASGPATRGPPQKTEYDSGDKARSEAWKSDAQLRRLRTAIPDAAGADRLLQRAMGRNPEASLEELVSLVIDEYRRDRT